MKTNAIYLSLLFLMSLFTQGHTQKLNTFTGCIIDQDGRTLIYADISYGENKSIQTDVDGCYHFEHEQSTTIATISYPGYLQKEITIKSNEVPTIVLNLWKAEAMAAGSPHSKPEKFIEREASGDLILSGTVMTADKEPLIGVPVQLVGTPYGTVTDIDGQFKLNSNKKCNDLLFTYIGFENKTMNVCHDDKVEVILTEAAVLLEEVAVTSMGRSRKRKRGTSSAPAPLSYSAIESASPPPPPPAPMAEMAYDDAMPAKTSAEATRMIPKDKETVEELPNAGQLTAGEVNDFSKWDMWEDISKEDLAEHRRVWNQFADHRYTLQLTTPDGLAIVNAPVQLNDAQGNVVWRTRTNNTGQAEMWAHYFLETERASNHLSITGQVGRRSFEIPNAKPFKDGINFYNLKADCNENPIIDIAFVVDATGSMGDEIAYLQAELLNVIGRINDSLPAADVQTASIFYKDKSDNYLTKIDNFSEDAGTTVKFIQNQGAGGGGDFPEAVDDAMEAAVEELNWREEATTRLLFLVLDAPPHQNEDNIKRMQVAVTKAATMGIQIIPVACSGINKSTEFLMRSMALATNGTYTFITDHSGIGNAHIEPSTDDYTVEFLNDVLVRLGVDRSRLQNCDNVSVATKMDKNPFIIGGTEEEEEWSFYPNPTTGPLNFRFENSDGMLHLFDASGKLLQRVIANERLKLNLSDYPAGTYWLKHQDTQGHWTQGQVILARR